MKLETVTLLPFIFFFFSSGQEVGPLMFEVPNVPKVGVLMKNQKVLSDKSNTRDSSQKSSPYMGLETSGNTLWNRSSLLNEVIVQDPFLSIKLSVYPFL